MFFKNLFKHLFSIVMVAIFGISMSASILANNAPTNINSNISSNNSSIITVQAAAKRTLADADKLNKTNNTEFAGGNGLLDSFCSLSGEAINKIAQLAGCAAAAIAFIVLTVAVVYMVYGAFIWLTDTEKGAERGRKIIFSSVIAMIVSVLAFALSALITSTLLGS